MNFFSHISEAVNEPNIDLMSNITFVTDQGTNMLSALRNIKRINCSAHLLNTVLRNLFDVKYLGMETNEDRPLEPIITLMKECKNLVIFMKSSGKNSHLSKSLVNTRLLMLTSVQNALPEIMEIHGENFNRIQHINRELL